MINVKKRKKKNNGVYGDLRRRGYDRCRRGFASVYGILYEQKRLEQAESLADLKTENRGQSETLENTEGMIIKLIEDGIPQMIN